MKYSKPSTSIKQKKIKFLDCTLRDGGYYTNWDFPPKVIENYIIAMDNLPIDFIEIGYRNIKSKDYFGEFYYSPINTINNINKLTNKSLVLILNEKDLTVNQIKLLLEPCIGKIYMVRLAVVPDKIDDAILKSKLIKTMGFEVALNVMYLSKWGKDLNFLKKFHKIEKYTDYLYLVDSYGAVFPSELKFIIKKIKRISKVKLGFHGHNNLELALANTITAIKEGVEIVDSTIMGMGRGSGNLKTELLMSILSKNYEINFNILTKTLEDFQELKSKHKWGTNLPYMIAGINGIPQKKIMEWLTSKFYNLTSVVKALNNNLYKTENFSFPLFSYNKAEKAIIIGGGDSVITHLKALKYFLENDKEIIIVLSSSRHLKHFINLENDKFLCLIGNENKRFEENNIDSSSNLKIILPPKPREMGTYIPIGWNQMIMELKEISFINTINHCSMALEIAHKISNKLLLIGFDGYETNSISEKQQSIFFENQKIFDSALDKNINLTSLVPTKYSINSITSIYSLIH